VALAITSEHMTDEEKFIALALLKSAAALSQLTSQDYETRKNLFGAHLIYYSTLKDNLTALEEFFAKMNDNEKP